MTPERIAEKLKPESLRAIRIQIQALNRLRKKTQEPLNGVQADSLIEIGHNLCDEVERLAAEVVIGQDQKARLEAQVESALRGWESAVAENAELRRDAERLTWLESIGEYPTWPIHMSARGSIDAAMQATAQGGEAK